MEHLGHLLPHPCPCVWGGNSETDGFIFFFLNYVIECKVKISKWQVYNWKTSNRNTVINRKKKWVFHIPVRRVLFLTTERPSVGCNRNGNFCQQKHVAFHT